MVQKHGMPPSSSEFNNARNVCTGHSGFLGWTTASSSGGAEKPKARCQAVSTCVEGHCTRVVGAEEIEIRSKMPLLTRGCTGGLEGLVWLVVTADKTSLNYRKFMDSDRTGLTHSWKQVGIFYLPGERDIITSFTCTQMRSTLFNMIQCTSFSPLEVVLQANQVSPNHTSHCVLSCHQQHTSTPKHQTERNLSLMCRVPPRCALDERTDCSSRIL